MAGTWFNGVMGTSYGNNYFGGWNGGQGYLYGNRPLSTVALSSDHTDRFTSGERGAVTQQTTALSQNNIANQQTRTNQQDLIVRHDSTPKNPTSKDRSE